MVAVTEHASLYLVGDEDSCAHGYHDGLASALDFAKGLGVRSCLIRGRGIDVRVTEKKVILVGDFPTREEFATLVEHDAVCGESYEAGEVTVASNPLVEVRGKQILLSEADTAERIRWAAMRLTRDHLREGARP